MKALKILLAVAAALISFLHAQAQTVIFDFDSAPLHTSLPLDITAGSITAHFSSGSPFYNYSIQRADTLGFTPVGFSGYCIYPNTVFSSDLLISFGSTLLTDISIMYAPEEYATDSSCTMRLTAYLGSTQVGTTTFSIDPPGTWPTGTLTLSSAQPFNNVVIHYDAPPITGGDYGPIFMVDNLVVTPAAIPPIVSSRKTHGVAGTFSIPMPLTGVSGVEPRPGNGGVAGTHTIVLSYTTSPAGATANVTAHNPSGATGSVSNVTVNGNDLVVDLVDVSNQQVLTLTTSGGSVIPTTVSIGFLLGDTSGNRSVNATDISQTKAQSGVPVTEANFRTDVNANGFINASDISEVKLQSGTAIP